MWEGIRSCGGVEQDVPVLQILRLWTVLQVLLQTVAPFRGANRSNGRLVDKVSVLGCHDERSG